PGRRLGRVGLVGELRGRVDREHPVLRDGAPGPAGPQGRPGRDAIVTCRVRGARVRCTVRAAAGARASVRVMRGGRTVRRVRTRTDRRGRLSFARRGLKGRYTLVIRVGKRSGRARMRVG
ncbi:MAG TPA: hypothetical protein VHF89_06925, partial [Solirubrobacteraceae bacterium]|nr:hypothetical protein [Solirubrobacteraceae bacterium]